MGQALWAGHVRGSPLLALQPRDAWPMRRRITDYRLQIADAREDAGRCFQGVASRSPIFSTTTSLSLANEWPLVHYLFWPPRKKRLFGGNLTGLRSRRVACDELNERGLATSPIGIFLAFV